MNDTQSLEERMEATFEQTKAGIIHFVELILRIYEDVGFEKMKLRVNPSLDELADIVHDLKLEVDKLPSLPNNPLMDMKKINLSQGLLYAESLISAVRNNNRTEGDFNEVMLKRSNI